MPPDGWTMHETSAATGAIFSRSPEMGILRRTRAPAPKLPLEVFGDFWSLWLSNAARGANAPGDYVALPLLTAASALIGNARWPLAWRGWREPPILWGCCVGDPSSGKSPGASAVLGAVLARVAAHMARNYPAELAAWEEKAAVARAIDKQWERDVGKAIKNDESQPARPDDATPPTAPVRPRANVQDATVEALAALMEGQPKGLLAAHDELAAWFLNMSRYANGGSDRPFWLQAWNGGSHVVDRVKRPDPIHIPHLSLALFGTVQPDRLADLLADADDGLLSRFLWAWPDHVPPFTRPNASADVDSAASALIRLADLEMPRDSNGHFYPSNTALTDAAAHALESFGREMQQKEEQIGGLMKGVIGKARGHVLRLALVLEYLWWCSDPTAPEPHEISERAVLAAAELMDTYFHPMAVRVLGDASIPQEERAARTLARWIHQTRPTVVNVSEVRDTARLDGLRETDSVKVAIEYLVHAGWLAAVPTSGRGGRPRGDYIPNPAIWEAQS